MTNIELFTFGLLIICGIIIGYFVYKTIVTKPVTAKQTAEPTVFDYFRQWNSLIQTTEGFTAILYELNNASINITGHQIQSNITSDQWRRLSNETIRIIINDLINDLELAYRGSNRQ